MSDNKLKIAIDQIRLLISELEKPVAEQNHIDRLENIEDAKTVLSGLDGNRLLRTNPVRYSTKDS